VSIRIAIVGGGLGGTAAALFLHQAGMDVTVYEQSSELVELGAGIIVAPNMVRLMLGPISGAMGYGATAAIARRCSIPIASWSASPATAAS
jgi:flavin-dependent dehydrogenase